jgi:hypothetical protein
MSSDQGTTKLHTPGGNDAYDWILLGRVRDFLQDLARRLSIENIA